jgi:hypothetical protein
MHEAVASKGPWVAIPYFVSYVLFSTYIVLKVSRHISLHTLHIVLKVSVVIWGGAPPC